MKGRREKLKGPEWDVFTRWRNVLKLGRGLTAWCKRYSNRRRRRRERRED